MNSSEEWQEWMSTWQSQPVDAPKLRRSTRWKTYRMALTTGSEILLTLFVWALLGRYWELSGDKPLLRGWMLSWSVLTPLLGWWTFRLRRGLWRATDESVMALLRLRLDRAHGGIRMARFTLWVCAIMAVVTGPWLVAVHSDAPPPSGAHWSRVWGPVLFVTVWLLVYVVGSLVYLRQRRQEIAQIERLLRKVDTTA